VASQRVAGALYYSVSHFWDREVLYTHEGATRSRTANKHKSWLWSYKLEHVSVLLLLKSSHSKSTFRERALISREILLDKMFAKRHSYFAISLATFRSRWRVRATRASGASVRAKFSYVSTSTSLVTELVPHLATVFPVIAGSPSV
jgi:hypothetical protein